MEGALTGLIILPPFTAFSSRSVEQPFQGMGGFFWRNSGDVESVVGGGGVEGGAFFEDGADFFDASRKMSEAGAGGGGGGVGVDAGVEGFGVGLEPDDFAGGFEGGDVFGSEDGAAAGGDDGVGAGGGFADGGGLAVAEAGFAFGFEDFFDGFVGVGGDEEVGVEEVHGEEFGEAFADGGFAGAAVADEGDVHGGEYSGGTEVFCDGFFVEGAGWLGDKWVVCGLREEKVMRRMWVVAAAVCLAGVQGAVWAEVPFTVSKETTGIVGPLKGDGMPDYVGAMNEAVKRGATPETNGAVKWLEVVGTDWIQPKIRAALLAACGAKESVGRAGNLDSCAFYLQHVEHLASHVAERGAAEGAYVMTHEWQEEEYPNVAMYLKGVEGELAGLKEAAERPHWWMPYVGETVMEASIPWIAAERNGAEALCMRATLRAKSGDFAGFLQDVGTVRRLARGAAGMTLIERIIARSMELRACETIGAVVGTGNLTGAQIEALEKWEQGWTELPAFAGAVDTTERWEGLEIAELIAVGKTERVKGLFTTDDGKVIVNTDGVDASRVDWDLVLKEMNEVYDAELAAMNMAGFAEMQRAMKAWGATVTGYQKALQKRGVDRAFVPDAGETKEAYSRRVGQMLVGVVAPSGSRMVEAEWELRLRWEMLGVLQGAAKMKAAHGKWPEKLEEIVGVKVPVDFYLEGGKLPVMYVQSEVGARVYSVGRNGKDDWGVADVNAKMDDFGVGVVEDFGVMP